MNNVMQDNDVQNQVNSNLASSNLVKSIIADQIKDDVVAQATGKAPKKKKGKFGIIMLVILFILLIGGGTAGLIYYNSQKIKYPQEIDISTDDMHSLNIKWHAAPEKYSYLVAMSTKTFDIDDLVNDLEIDRVSDDFTIIDVEKKTEYATDDVLSNKNYYIAVVAYTVDDNVRKYYKFSDSIKFKTGALKVGTIDDLTVSDVTTNQAKLNWSKWSTIEKNLDGSDVKVSYTLFITDVHSSEVTKIVEEGNVEEYTLDKLSPFSKYICKVVISVVMDGKTIEGKDSNLATIRTKMLPLSVVTAKNGGTSSINVKWNAYSLAGTNVTADEEISIVYDVYGSDKANSNFKLLAKDVTSTSYTETKLSGGQTRYYYVIAKVTRDTDTYESLPSKVVGDTTELTAKQKENAANTVAKQIAKSSTGATDLAKVQKAAQSVYNYYRRAKKTTRGSDCNIAYGVLVKGEASSAGATNALGMVLTNMGYSWKNVNNQYVTITMDGQVGWASAITGRVAYGQYPS